MIREKINNLIYQLYVNKNESRTQKEEDDKNEENIDQATSQIKAEIIEELPKGNCKHKKSPIELP